MRAGLGWGVVLGWAGVALLGCEEPRELLTTRPADLASGGTAGSAGDTGGGASVGVVWRTLSGHKYHTCALRAGQPWCWGRNDGGTFGAFADAFTATPVLVPTAFTANALATGLGFTCAIGAANDVYCWGQNSLGQLGVGDLDQRSEPTRVLLAEGVRQLAADDDHVCAVTLARTLYCWGNNRERQLGLGGEPEAPPVPTPTRVGSEADWSMVEPGQGHTCGIRAGGELWCWGRNVHGELGLGPGAEPQYGEPVRVGDRSDWSAVSAGQLATCALRRDGTTWCWGDNAYGALGVTATVAVLSPTQVGTRTDTLDLVLNNFNACALTQDADWLCWGWNELGSLGQGDLVARSEPALLPPPGNWREQTVGWQHNCALDREGRIWCVGRNDEGECGDGTTELRTTLVEVAFP